MKINDKDATKKLEAVRQRVGGKPVAFVLQAIEEDLDTKTQINELFHQSGLLVYKGRPIFAYIRDHHGQSGNLEKPENRKKLHFSVCETLREMEEQGRMGRYRVTNKENNVYSIDTDKGVMNVTLYPCKNCLEERNYQGFSYSSPGKKDKIRRDFDAGNVLPALQEEFRAAVKQLKSAEAPTGYARNFGNISKQHREQKGYVCDECGVDLKKFPDCVDTHHINGDKSNNRPDNLQCLCKLCHAKKHPHFKPSSYHCEYITMERRRQERRKQGIR